MAKKYKRKKKQKNANLYFSVVKSEKEQFMSNPLAMHKYLNKSGIYAIYVDKEFAYIGQSKNLIGRLGDHYYAIFFQQKDLEHRYEVLRELHLKSHLITFDVIEYCDKEELRDREAYYIQKYNPPLNILTMQGKGSTNDTARKITAEEFLAMEKFPAIPSAFDPDTTPINPVVDELMNELAELAKKCKESGGAPLSIKEFEKEFFKSASLAKEKAN